jgi:small subunit ribosomal protein S1
VDIGHVKDISIFLGQALRSEIIELDRRNRNVLLSHKRVAEREQYERKDKLLAELAEGQIRKGKVGNLAEFGAFVDLGGVDGLIHISDLSYKQVEKVSDVITPGQEVEVKVLKVDRKRGRIGLGLKQVKPDPWTDVEQKYPVGTQVTVRVLRLERFGAIVEVEEGVEGLVHVTELSWRRIGKPSAVLEVGQMAKAVVIRVEPKEHRIRLSIKQVEADPWSEVPETFAKHSTHTGKVTKCEKFGAFVELAPGVEGLVHISELSDQRVKKCEDVVQPGEEVQVRVLDVDTESRRISLSIKALKETDAGEVPGAGPEAPAPKPKRKRPLRGGLTSHFEWQGQPLKRDS